MSTNLCKLCFSKQNEYFPILYGKGLILNKYFNSKEEIMWSTDYTTDVICETCWTIVENFHQLYTSVVQNYKDLCNIKSITVSVKKESLKDEPCFEIDRATVQYNIEKTISEVEVTETLVNSLPEDQPQYEVLHDGDYKDDQESQEEEEYIPKSMKKKKSAKGTKNKEKDVSLKYPSSKYTEIIKKYFHMTCDLCSVPFKNFIQAKKHHEQIHKHNGYIVCCGKKFFKLYRVRQHCIWHDNPDAFKCKTCSKNFQDSIGLKDHMDFVHCPEEQKLHKCELCSKSFMRKHMLTAHIKLQHMDKKFECDQCGQKFVIQAFLQSHIRRVHENSDSRICDVCAKFFKCSKSYEMHYLTVHTDIQQKVQCEICGKWLKHAESLKEHKRRHTATSETCQYCGRISSNKKALRAHVLSAHSAPKYPCTICNKLFKKTQTLKEHMAIHAGRTDLYNCSFCAKTFRSSANMYAHRKKAHPKEYEEAQTRGKDYAKTQIILTN